MRQGTIEEMAKIERVPAHTGCREGLLWQRILEEMAKIERVPAEQVAERGFCGRES